jgi:predicted transcriptional regulator
MARFVYPEAAALARCQEMAMSGSTAKQKVLEAMEKLPPDATVEDAIERLVLLAKIERGLAELDAGQGVEHSEAKRRLLR